MTTQHTPGPWRWKYDRSIRTVELVHPGHGRLTVLSSTRRGFAHATLQFARRSEADRGGILMRADEFAVALPKDRHDSDYIEVDNPDARLIAAAPALLDALRTAVSTIEQLIPDSLPRGVADVVLYQARAAIAAATEARRD